MSDEDEVWVPFLEVVKPLRGPVHVLDAGRYYATLVKGVPMIVRADTAGAVVAIETEEETATA